MKVNNISVFGFISSRFSVLLSALRSLRCWHILIASTAFATTWTMCVWLILLLLLWCALVWSILLCTLVAIQIMWDSFITLTSYIVLVRGDILLFLIISVLLIDCLNALTVSIPLCPSLRGYVIRFTGVIIMLNLLCFTHRILLIIMIVIFFWGSKTWTICFLRFLTINLYPVWSTIIWLYFTKFIFLDFLFDFLINQPFLFYKTV